MLLYIPTAWSVTARFYCVPEEETSKTLPSDCKRKVNYRGADKSLARPGRKEATATEDFDVHISYLLS